jgi:hypothetical protein
MDHVERARRARKRILALPFPEAIQAMIALPEASRQDRKAKQSIINAVRAKHRKKMEASDAE